MKDVITCVDACTHFHLFYELVFSLLQTKTTLVTNQNCRENRHKSDQLEELSAATAFKIKQQHRGTNT